MDKKNQCTRKNNTTKKTSHRRTAHKKGGSYPRVLALTPMNGGFGYAVFESPHHVLDYGLTNIRVSRVSRSLLRLETLIKEYQPSVIVCTDTGRDHTTVAQKILRSIQIHCKNTSQPFRRYRRARIKQEFSQFGAVTRYDIIDQLIEWLPDLERVRPKRGALWETEDMRMKIFDAVAVAIVFFAIQEECANQSITTK